MNDKLDLSGGLDGRTRDRWIEAVLGGRLMFQFPLGSVKTDAAANRVDRITVRWMRLRAPNRDLVAELRYP